MPFRIPSSLNMSEKELSDMIDATFYLLENGCTDDDIREFISKVNDVVHGHRVILDYRCKNGVGITVKKNRVGIEFIF